MVLGKSSFKFKRGTLLVVENAAQKLVADQFAGLFEKPAGWKLQVALGGDEGSNQVYLKQIHHCLRKAIRWKLWKTVSK